MMERIRVAAVSVKNLIGDIDASIGHMQRWAARVGEQGAELVLFPELNVSGYVPAPIAAEIAEPVPGPSCERVVRIARQEKLAIAFGLSGMAHGYSVRT